jgi:hypothetical protein
MTTLPPVQIKLVMGGIDEVQKSLQTVEQALKKFEDRMNAIKEAGAKKRQKTEEKAGQEGVKAQKDHARTKLSDEEKSARNMLKIRERSATMAGRIASKQAAEEIATEKKKGRELESELKRQSEARRRAIASGINGVGRSVGRAVGTVARLGGAVSAFAGGFTVADSVSGQVRAEKAAALFSNSAADPNNTVSTKDALARANELSKRYGIDSSDILEGMHSFTAKTGDAKGAMGLADLVSKISIAEGVGSKDLMGAAGMIKAQNENISDDQLKRMLLDMVGMGKKGSVEIGDMAASAAKATATAGFYEGDQTDNQRKLLGFAQIAMKATGSPEEAATAVANLSSDIVKHKSNFEALGLHAFNKDGKIRDINELIADSVVATGGRADKLHELYGERGGRPVAVLGQVFQNAEAKQKGSGGAAVRAYQSAIQDATITMEQLEKEFGKTSEKVGQRLNVALETLKVTVGEQLLPEFMKLLPTLENLVPKVAELMTTFVNIIDYLGNNPFKAAFLGLGAVVTESIVSQLGGQLISKGIEKSLMALGASGGISLAGLTIGAAVVYMAVQELKRREGVEAKGQNEAESDASQLGNLRDQLKSGQISPEDYNKQVNDIKLKKEAMEHRAAQYLTGGVLRRTGLEPGQDVDADKRAAGYTGSKREAEELAAALKEGGEATGKAIASAFLRDVTEADIIGGKTFGPSAPPNGSSTPPAGRPQ